MTVVMALEKGRFMVVTTLQNNVQEQRCIFSHSFCLTKSCLCHKLLQQEITVAIVNSIRTLVIMEYRSVVSAIQYHGTHTRI